MHDVADVEAEDPVVCRVVFHAQSAACRDFEFLLDLKFIHFFESLERNFQPFFLGHTVLEKVPSLLEVQLTDLAELFLDPNQLLDDVVCFENLLLEDFHFLRNVLAATTVGRR